MVAIVRCENGIVTDEYLNIIGDAFAELGRQVVYLENISQLYVLPKTVIVVTARIIDSVKAIIHGYRNLVVWFQGVEPEESFLRHKSRIRLVVLNILERYIIKEAKFLFFVSDAMKRHYEEKYNLTFPEETYYVMPCLNTDIHEDAFSGEGKYSNNVFTYVGSLAVWQGFDKIVAIYKKIEGLGLKNTELRVYTNEQQKAKEILEKANIKKFSVGYVKNEDLNKALAGVKYGFIIRDDNVVNRVSTPTKISTYMSCGVIPVYSECLRDYHRIAKNLVYAINVDKGFFGKLENMDKTQICGENVLLEYKSMFCTYYNREYHEQQVAQKLKECNCFFIA